MKNRLSLILGAFFVTELCVAQTHKTYTGASRDN